MDISKEFELRFFDIPFGNSAFQNKKFIMEAQYTPARGYRAIGLRLADRIQALKEYEFSLRLEEVDIEELEEKLAEIHFKLEETEKKINNLLDSIEKTPDQQIREAYEGCDGPLGKVTRDFVIGDPAVTLIDVEAGVEHFGRGIAINVDEVIVVVDPTYESFTLAERVRDLCAQMDIYNVWAVLNKVLSIDAEKRMVDAMNARDITILGIVHHDRMVEKAGMDGTSLMPCTAMTEAREITQHLETVATQGHAAAVGS